jgi:toxin-antitoxin system PIN domain toxin
VILLDANLLVYARVSEFAQHQRARVWLDDRLNGSLPVGFPWSTLIAFLRLVSNPRIFERPEPMPQAWHQVEAWLGSPVAWIPQPTPGYREVLGRLLVSYGARANLVPDAHLAALAIEHGLVLCSSDSDFARFPGLRWDNPLGESIRRG